MKRAPLILGFEGGETALVVTDDTGVGRGGFKKLKNTD